MGLVSKIRKARRLSSAEWGLLLQATVLLWRAAWLLRRRSLTQMLAWTEQPARRAPAGQVPPAQWIAELVTVAAQTFMPAGSCLPQSLVTTRLMKQAGYRASVVIGARTREAHQPFVAHAWVEVAPRATSEAPLEINRGSHEPLARFRKSA